MEKFGSKDFKLFVPLGFKKKLSKKLKNTKIIEFADIQNIYSNNTKNPLLPYGYYTLSVYKALSVCLWLGYKKIYICGIDNNWFKSLYSNKQNELYTIDNHFYDL